MTDKERIEVYVIKRDDGKYYKVYHSYEYGDEVEFTEYLEDAKIFDHKTTAYNCTRDIELEFGDCCEVVPVTIVEGDVEENQNQVAIEQLEKVKQSIDLNKSNFYRNVHIISAEFVMKKIDQQINELKGKV